MLDELGNLQSEGHGINGFQTYLSIGLGQEQQFTLILQTLQQLRDVYGDSVDKVIQGNTSNIVFLKSTDDSMLDTLQKMSGVTHKSYVDSKTITKDAGALIMQNDNKITYTKTTKEVPVITYNDMAFIAERNSIVFRAGDSPIWNRNQTILPMSWKLYGGGAENTIVHPGHTYSLQTIPTLSSALDFDVRQNQPNFDEMLEHRKEQALLSKQAQDAYKEAYGYSDYDISQIDPDVYADEIMAIINETLEQSKQQDNKTEQNSDYFSDTDMAPMYQTLVTENTEVVQEAAKAAQKQQADDRARYAGLKLSRSDLYDIGGVNHQLDNEILQAFIDCKGDMMQDTKYFRVNGSNLCSADGQHVYFEAVSSSETFNALQKEAENPNSRVFSEYNLNKAEVNKINNYRVTDDFYKFLVSLERWNFAKGRFEEAMSRIIEH